MERRNMTADELERFEREKLHHEQPKPDAGPASDPQAPDPAAKNPKPPAVLPPNPD